jgi:hypothetical protein
LALPRTVDPATARTPWQIAKAVLEAGSEAVLR